MTLHEAIQVVIRQKKQPMTATEIAKEINTQQLYIRGDRNPVPASQIHARIKNYPHLFSKVDNKIDLFNFYRDFRSNKPISLDETLDKLVKKVLGDNILSETEAVLFVCGLAISTRYIQFKYDWEGFLENINHEVLINKVKQLIVEQHILSEVFEIILKNDYILKRKFIKTTLNRIVFLLSGLDESEFKSYLKRFLKGVGILEKEGFKHNYSTPPFVNKLLVELVNPIEGDLVFDPASGLGGTLIQAFKNNNKISIVGQELNFHFYLLSKVIFYSNECESYSLFFGDSILSPNLEKFVANVIVSDPPSGLRFENARKPNFNRYSKDNSSESFFIDLMLSRLEPANGRMAVVIPYAFLTHSSNIKLREKLINDDTLEAVISLPKGSFLPGTQVYTAIMVVNNNKILGRRGKVLFIDAQKSVEFQIKNGELQVNIELLKELINEIIVLFRGAGEIEKYVKSSLVVASDIVNQDYNLTPVRYTSDIIESIERLGESENLIELNRILRTTRYIGNKDAQNKEKVVQIKDLDTDGYDYKLMYYELQSQNLKDWHKIISNSALLIARIGHKLKPTYFENDNNKLRLAITGNIQAFDIIKKDVHPEFLISQLNSDFFIKQLETIQSTGVIPSLPVESFLKLKIPLPPLAEQLNRLAMFKEEQANKFKLTNFIKDIQLVTSFYELEKEIERFSKKVFKDSEYIVFRNEFDFAVFPFSSEEISATTYIKKTIEQPDEVSVNEGSFYYNLLLRNEDKGINGVLTVQSENEISFEQYSEINAYTNFLIKTSEYITKQVANDSLAKFAHTQKNFFMRLVGELSSIVDTENEELVRILSSNYVESKNIIERKKKQGKELEQYLLLNKLEKIYHQIISISKFYNTTDINFKEIKDGEYSDFNIVGVIEECKPIAGNINIEKCEEEIMVHAKQNAIRQSIVDLLQNSIKYSQEKKSDLTIQQNDTFVTITISNRVDKVLPEITYRDLGKKWLTSQNETSISAGLYWAKEAITNSKGSLELIDYHKYSKEFFFQVIIKLKKSI